MTTHDKDKIIAAAKEADSGFTGDDDFNLGTSIVGLEAIECFYAIAFEDGHASRETEIAYLQSRIDELMLEYCPNEMTEEQLANWAAHQRPVDESELPEAIRARGDTK